VPDTVLAKFGDERSLLGYWWDDADSAAELKAAMSAKDVLPRRPEWVDFDAIFPSPSSP